MGSRMNTVAATPRGERMTGARVTYRHVRGAIFVNSLVGELFFSISSRNSYQYDAEESHDILSRLLTPNPHEVYLI